MIFQSDFSGLHAHLAQLLAGADLAAHRARDPVRFAWRYADPHDQAWVSLFAATLAYGRASLIGGALEGVCARLGPSPSAALADDHRRGPAAARARFEGFVYRLTRGEDLARLWHGLGGLQAAHGDLGTAFNAGDDPAAPDLRPAMASLRARIRAHTAAHFPDRQAFGHLLPDAAGTSANKRLNLWLRWLVRGPDAVDLGLWSHLGAHRLLMPVDTHVHRLARYLGLTARTTADHRTAVEVTAALRRLDPADPLRYDFALAHLGISGACVGRPVAEVCRACPLQPVCVVGRGA